MPNQPPRRWFSLANYEGLVQLPEIQRALRETDRKIQTTEMDHKRAKFVCSQTEKTALFLPPREESLEWLLDEEHRQFADPSVDIEREVLIREIHEALHRAFSRLSEKEKWLLGVRYLYEAKSQAQVAQEMGIAQQTVSRWEKRTLNKLRKYLLQEYSCTENFFEVF